MQKQFKLTKDRLEELKQELVHLRTVREREVAEQIKEARSFGDLSENSEYDEAKNEQGKLYSRIAELENIIANAVIISEAAQGKGVTMGVKVTLTIDGAETEYTIVGSQEANPFVGRLSDESPIGKAI
ncbi:MAG: transcription elongation factor GreA, partial [Clostridia bacterium]|nr:transcription elongation factor GreA [Clostridia bacterium]